MFRYSFLLVFLFFVLGSFAQNETTDAVQLELQNGVSPKQLLKQGVKKDELYGKMYQGC